MFVQPEQAATISAIVSNSSKNKQLEEVLHTLSTNSDKDMERAFKSSIQENPHDPTHRLIYADWLEERGRPTEAHLHRLISQDPHMMNILSRPPMYNNPTRRRRGEGYVMGTPLQTARTANGMSKVWSGMTEIERKARDHAAEAVKQARIGAAEGRHHQNEQAAEQHFLAAIHHLQAANNNATRGAAHNRLAVQAHIIAAGVHRGEYPTEQE